MSTIFPTAKSFLKNYVKWLVATLAFSLAYVSEKWAGQSWPTWPTEWIGVISFNLLAPIVAAYLNDPMRRLFVNPFEPRTVDASELGNVNVFVGVDNLRSNDPKLSLSAEQREVIENYRDQIRNDSSLTCRHSNVDEEQRTAREKLKDLHFPAAYGTLGLLKNKLSKSAPGRSHRFLSIGFICTQAKMLDSQEQVKTYAKEILTLLGVIDDETKLTHHFHTESDARDVKSLVLRFEQAIIEAKRVSKSSTAIRTGIDTTGGTVLHTIAGVKVANTEDALLFYNQSSHEGNDLLLVEV